MIVDISNKTIYIFDVHMSPNSRKWFQDGIIMGDFLFGKMIICSGVWVLRPLKIQYHEFLFDKNFCFFQNHAQALKLEYIVMKIYRKDFYK